MLRHFLVHLIDYPSINDLETTNVSAGKSTARIKLNFLFAARNKDGICCLHQNCVHLSWYIIENK